MWAEALVFASPRIFGFFELVDIVEIHEIVLCLVQHYNFVVVISNVGVVVVGSIRVIDENLAYIVQVFKFFQVIVVDIQI